MPRSVAFGGRGRVEARAAARKTATLCLSLGLGAVLAGCSLSPNIGLKRDAALGEVSDADLRAPQKVSPAGRYQDVEVRTEIRRAGVAVSGADCTARSSAVSLDFKTPGRIVLPLLEPSTPPLTIRCEHPLQGVATMVLRTGAAPEADSLFEEIFGADAPAAGRYLPRYTLQLVKPRPKPLKPAEAAGPPNALSAAMELSEPQISSGPERLAPLEWPQAYPGPYPRPKPRFRR